ncbi:MAG TPA: hypothetical protein PLP73_04550, partial [Candidatus Absconditabacterales bacterium]|nr:hypothetical protein [Candidatus Absconditabacterales bacterium]
MSKFSKYQSKKGGLRYPSLQSSVNINKLLTYPDISQNFTTQINTVPNTTIESNNSDLDESVAEWVARRKQKKELESKQTGLVRQENKTVSNLENVFKPLSSNTSNSIPTLSTVSITSPVLEETNNISSLTENIVQSELDDNKVKEQIRYHEGSRRNKNGEHVAYIDSRGNKTIGYGRLWKHGDPDKMSEEQAVQAFDNDYNSH